MDSVVAVIICNCVLSFACLIGAYCSLRLRRQVVALGNWCEQWATDCDAIAHTPAVLADTRARFDRFQQLYQQQAIVFNRLRTLGLAIAIVRSIVWRR